MDRKRTYEGSPKVKPPSNDVKCPKQYASSYLFSFSPNQLLLSLKQCRRLINIQGTRYPIVRKAAEAQKWQVASDVPNFNLLWVDQPINAKDIRELPRHVRVNHFADIVQITRKNLLTVNINAMKFREYDFYPEAWLLPTDLHRLLKQHSKGKCYIIKPEGGCQGRGIFLTMHPGQLDKTLTHVAQEYIQNPMLINELKFDLRIYVLITCVNPLRVYLYDEGMARFATEPFQKPSQTNLDCLYQHLTNYAINKENENFKIDQDKGHKRLLSSMFSGANLVKLKSEIADIAVKTIISGLAFLRDGFAQTRRDCPNSCFQLLGFDILLTEDGCPHLLEVNNNPSLFTESQFDEALKLPLIKNILSMVDGHLGGQGKVEMANKDDYELKNCGLFKRVYPCDSPLQNESYNKYIQLVQSMYHSKFGTNIIRANKRVQQPKDSEVSVQWNQTSSFYSKDKMQNIYGTSQAKINNRFHRYASKTASHKKDRTMGLIH